MWRLLRKTQSIFLTFPGSQWYHAGEGKMEYGWGIRLLTGSARRDVMATHPLGYKWLRVYAHIRTPE
jgi:hypothetical protein